MDWADWAILALPAAVVLLWYGFWIRVGVLVARDANRRGMKGWAWGVLVAQGAFVGILVYRYFRSPWVEHTTESTDAAHPGSDDL